MKNNIQLFISFLFSFFLLFIFSFSYSQDYSQISKDAVGTPGNIVAVPGPSLQCLDNLVNQALDPPNYFTARTSDRDPNLGFLISDNFMLSEDYAVNSACWWGIYVDFGSLTECTPGAADDNFQISYLADNAGQPGAVIAGPFDVVSSRVNTGQPFAFTSIYQYEASHPSVNLKGGLKYWVRITNNHSNKTGVFCGWLWVDNTTAPGDGISHQEEIGVGGMINTTDQAFNLGGVLDAIPTLSQWGLIILGLILLTLSTVALKRRKEVLSTEF